MVKKKWPSRLLHFVGSHWILTSQRRMLPPFFRVNYPGSSARIFTNQNQRKGRGDRPFTRPTKLETFK